MRRRKAVKTIALGAISPHLLIPCRKSKAPASAISPHASSFESTWHQWPDMKWTGPEFWGNRLQDWQVKGGKALCNISGENRTLHCLCCQLTERAEPFETSVRVDWLNQDITPSSDCHVGFLLGAKGRFDDYRSAAVFGEGLPAGITSEGRLFIGAVRSQKNIPLKETMILSLSATPQGANYTLRLSVASVSEQMPLDEVIALNISRKDLTGNIALRSNFAPGLGSGKPSAAFERWVIKGPKVNVDMQQSFGPVCFAQYTVHNNILKLTAQLSPVESIPGYHIFLEVKEGGQWKSLNEGSIDALGRSAHFSVDGWHYSSKVPYRVRLELPLRKEGREFFYEGEIAREPIDANQVKMAVFSCNCDHGFPDADVPSHVNKHNPDVAVFLGDQFYESTGGFGVDRQNADLDYLRKWYMFGWSYRDIFRNIPSITIPDDHDVYHGNVWGEGGKQAPTDKGWGYDAQDQGGYKMPAEWVNMVQKCQTSHLPDPYDPTRVKQQIQVYYTGWNYAGISMAILEDRKFKSAPKNVLPAEAKVVNGFIQNPDFNIKEYYDVEAELLGERQVKFLNDWATDWQEGVEMKVVLSQTNFCAVATLPKGSIIDNMVPRLPIPGPGEYVQGDAPTSDMDSNGWPQKERDEALKIIRKCFALHIAGDQHLASVVHYGVDEYGDAGFAFTAPALNNLWPRRWWPPLEGHTPLPGRPPYTGNFEDGFGNRMTVLAVANPRKTGKFPAIIHDRATGYGIVTFDKKKRTMRIECWPRYADPEKDPDGQFQGWPITIRQEENYGRMSVGYLPTIRIENAKDPVIQVVNERNGEVEYALRINGNIFQPKVFETSTYTVKLRDTATGKEQTIKGLVVATDKNQTLNVKL